LEKKQKRKLITSEETVRAKVREGNTVIAPNNCKYHFAKNSNVNHALNSEVVLKTGERVSEMALL